MNDWLGGRSSSAVSMATTTEDYLPRAMSSVVDGRGRAASGCVPGSARSYQPLR
jgi:hypothetical protein